MRYTQWEIMNSAELELLTFATAEEAITHYLSNYALENEGETCATIRDDEGDLVATITVIVNYCCPDLHEGTAIVVRCRTQWDVRVELVTQHWIKWLDDHYEVKEVTL